MFRVYPIVTAYELRHLQSHWASLHSMADNEGLVKFLGAVRKPFYAEVFEYKKRLEMKDVADKPVLWLVDLILSMAKSLHTVQQDMGSLLGSLNLDSYCLNEDGPATVKILPYPTIFKRETPKTIQDALLLPPEVLEGAPWDSRCDVYQWGQLATELALSNKALAESENAMYAKMITFVCEMAKVDNPDDRSTLESIVQIIENSIR